MASLAQQPVRSRRYGTVTEPSPQGEAHFVLDTLGSSSALPPPAAMAGDATGSRAALSAFQERASAHAPMSGVAASPLHAEQWLGAGAVDDGASPPAVRTLLPTQPPDGVPASLGAGAGLSRSRSFLDAFRAKEERPWLDEADDDDMPSFGGHVASIPASVARPATVTDVEDEEAPRARRRSARVSTALASSYTAPDLTEWGDAPTSVPIATATAATLARLTTNASGAPAEPETAAANGAAAPVEKKKKPKAKSADATDADGVVKKKKKRDKDGKDADGTTRRKKKVPLHARDAAAGEVAAAPEEPAEVWYGDAIPTTTYLDALPGADGDGGGAARAAHDFSEARAPDQFVDADARDHFALEPVIGWSGASGGVDATAGTAAAVPATRTPVRMEAPPAAAADDVEGTIVAAPPTGRAIPASPPRAQPYNENSRILLLNYNASRLAVNMFILYRGAFVMLRKLWRWERPWATGLAAALYLVVWWRGDLLAVLFLCIFLYGATFRLLHMPSEEVLSGDAARAESSGGGRLKRTPSTMSLTRRRAVPGTVAAPLAGGAALPLLQQVGDQILVLTHSLADMHERMKNLAMWRSPYATLQYLGWSFILVLVSAHVTTWMMVKLPGFFVFVLLFIVAPMIEYGHWHRVVGTISDVTASTGGATRRVSTVSRTMLDNVLAGVPTDEEYMQQTLLRTGWEAERERRRRGDFVELAPNRIVEEEPDPSQARVSKPRAVPRTARPRRVLQRYEDATDDASRRAVRERRDREEKQDRNERRRSRVKPPPQPDMSGVFSDGLDDGRVAARAVSREGEREAGYGGVARPLDWDADTIQRVAPPPRDERVGAPARSSRSDAAELRLPRDGALPAAGALPQVDAPAAAHPTAAHPITALPMTAHPAAADTTTNTYPAFLADGPPAWAGSEATSAPYGAAPAQPPAWGGSEATPAPHGAVPAHPPAPRTEYGATPLPPLPAEPPRAVSPDARVASHMPGGDGAPWGGLSRETDPGAPPRWSRAEDLESIASDYGPPEPDAWDARDARDARDAVFDGTSGRVSLPSDRASFRGESTPLPPVPTPLPGDPAAALPVPVPGDAAAMPPAPRASSPPLGRRVSSMQLAPSGPRQFIPAQSDHLQDHLERMRRGRPDDAGMPAMARRTSQGSLRSMTPVELLHPISPAVSVEAVQARLRSSSVASSSPQHSSIRWMDREHAPPAQPRGRGGIYLAVHRKRVGHLVVLPRRIVFQLSYTTIKPPAPPYGLTDGDVQQLSHVVDGRLYYPAIAPAAIAELVRPEMEGGSMTPFEPAGTVLSSIAPSPSMILFDLDAHRVTGLKKTRKNTPLLAQCPEGLEIVVAGEKSMALPAVVNRDDAFQRIVGIDPRKWG
ncbi:hypothetical protein MSPP1_000267 [Malassezia sp. CBS 17886]|nr:hypothetical protein MSPP1_000267 [Malassezia sp. CBS 17886]